MIHSNEILTRIAKDRMQDFRKEAAIARQRPGYRQRLAARLMKIAKWLEPEVESAPAPELLSR